MGGRKIIMKKNTIKTIVNAFVSVAFAIGEDLIETLEDRAELIEEKTREVQLTKEWFARFKSLPASYRIKTYRSKSNCVEYDAVNGVLICSNEGGNVRVAIPFCNEDGKKMFLVKDIFGAEEEEIEREDVTVLYKGSIENCWLRWYTFEKKNLG